MGAPAEAPVNRSPENDALGRILLAAIAFTATALAFALLLTPTA